MVDTVGDGPDRVLALHGWFGSARDGWGALPGLIDRDRFTWAFLDYRGYGERRGEAGEHTIAEAAADALALAGKLGWDRFSVVGHSMGGMVAQRVLADAPDRVVRLAGISPVPAGGVPFDEQGRALFDGAAADPANRRAIIDLTTGNRLSGWWLDRMVRASLDGSDPAAFGAYLSAWADTDISAAVAGNPVPALAVVGAHDPALGADTMRATWLTHYPNARLEILPDAGHYAMEEAPVRLATVLEEFLADR
ncbi:alpha/beta fold hydrolase [Spirilliplanes yamanashiensis]|uniref:Esterase n=1 Tax=Spirilliplanes yamanashiensis TaxID=42233 RepID=A0A8J3YA36_9ACTN|nr:alpha/beta hydrolase [Spirilliplanes yamanashiensis]MDP9815893.1 pimeloyl-ACP methyl ester carboxylesterase [Spirilliplanes yamanashiensis]GIJ04149.1 esterase [Spirilliplanes yamanashiensis]